MLAGYGPEDLIDKAPPPEPPAPQVDYKLNLTMTLGELLSISPQAGALLEQKMLLGEVSVDTKAKNGPATMLESRMAEAAQNGSGMMLPDRTGQVVDGTNAAAQGMSEGGQAG